MLIWTRRTTELLAVTIRVETVMTGEDFVKVLVMDRPAWVNETVSASVVEVLARDHLARHLRARLDVFGDVERGGVTPEEFAELWTWARGQVLRHWPALEKEIPETWT